MHGQPDHRVLWGEYGTWYRGDPIELAKWYRQHDYRSLDVRPSQLAGGLYGWLGRMFWGQPQVGTQGDMERLHIPAAADISALSADLLYTEQPTITVEAGTPAVDRLQEMLADGGVYAIFAEAAELASAYGSAYLRISVDREIAEYPVVEAMTPHCAIPEWRAGGLVACAFWRVLADPRGGILRLLERHERGYVQHQLRLGTETKLGKSVPLASHPETRRLASLADADGVIPTGIDLLDVVHQPNVLPNRECPDSYYGRSDYAGALGAMQGLDETWSLWMDALRLARPRLVVPTGYLRGLGPGKGATFDPGQRVFTGVEALDPSQPLQIEQVEFNVAVDTYERTSAGQWRNIVRHAGLSADAFGEEASGAQATATEVGQRGARTISTRERKLRYATPTVRRTSAVLIAYDAVYYPEGGSDPAGRVRVKFPDGVTVDPTKQAQVVQWLDAASAISLDTKVAMAHPDWDDDQIAVEVAKIKGEQESITAAAPVDPGTFDAPEPPMLDVPPENGRVPVGYVGA